jgi:hypothetical protein
MADCKSNEKVQKIESEEELPLSEEFKLYEAEHEALLRRKKRLEKRFGRIDARPPSKKPGEEPDAKNIPTQVIEAIARFNGNGNSICVTDPEKTSTNWSPDQCFLYKTEMKIMVRICGLARKSSAQDAESKQEPFSFGEIEEFEKELALYLEKEIQALPGQIDIELAIVVE